MQASNINYQYFNILEDFITTLGKKTPPMGVLKRVLPYTLALSDAEVGAFMVVEDITANQPSQMILIAQQGLNDEIISLVSGGGFGQQLLSGQPVWAGVKSLQLDIVQNLLRRYKLKSLFGMPLLFNGNFLGAIIVGTRNPKSRLFNPNTRQQLNTLAYLVAFYLDHVRLQSYNHIIEANETDTSTQSASQTPSTPASGATDELEHLLAAVMAAEEEVASQNKDLGMLNTISNTVGNTLHLSNILGDGIEQTMNALKADAGWCYMLEGDMLVMAENRGLSEKYLEGLGRLNPGNGTDGMAFARNEPILRDSLLFHSGKARTLVQQEGLRAVAAVPLGNNGIPFGVLAVGKKREQSWSVRDERMLVSISQRMAQAVSNARIYAQVEHQVHDLELKNKELQQANIQQAEAFEMLKLQIREILRLQERALHAQTGLRIIPGQGDAAQIEANAHLIASLRRALEVISAA